MSTIDAIAQLLESLPGRDNATPSADIVAQLKSYYRLRVTTRALRRAISNEDWPARGMLIVAVPGAGYFSVRNSEEANDYYAHLCGLTHCSKAKAKKFRQGAEKLGFRLHPKTHP